METTGCKATDVVGLEREDDAFVRQTRLWQEVTAIALPFSAGFKMISDCCLGVGIYPFLVIGIMIDYVVE